MKKEISISFIIFSLVLLLPLFFNSSSATIARGSPFFNLSSSIYGPSQPIEGFVNFSLINQNSDIKISANSSYSTKSMKLIDFLKKSNAVFTCTPSSCLPIYSFVSGSEEPSKQFSLKSSNKVLGIKIQGFKDVKVNNISFMIRGSSNQEFTCSESFVKIDVLDDSAINYEYISSNEANNCTDFTNSCFSMSNTVDFVLDSNLRCEKIFIDKAGKADIGAYVTLSSGDPSPLIMSLYDPKTAKSYNCTIGETDGTLTGFNSCSINAENNPNFFIDEARDVYVCISNPEGTGSYSIKGESDYPCGFLGSPEGFDGNFLFDYPIYMRYYGFSPINGEEILFEDSKFRSEDASSLISYLQDYINSRYSGNCLSGCIIPVNFIANGEQTLAISDIILNLSTSGGQAIVTKLWDLTKTPVSVSMPNSVFTLNAFNISAPSTMGNYRFILTLGTPSSVLFKVSNVPTIQSITPLFIAPNKPTTFYASVQKFQNPISNYTWDWGDGSSITTTIPQASHIYGDGVFNLTIKATDSAGIIGSKTFIINSTLTRETLNLSYLEKKRLYQSFLTQNQNLWYADILYNTTSMNNSLNMIDSLIRTSGNLGMIKSQLDSIKIPISINDTRIFQEGTYYQDTNKINLDHLVELGAGVYSEDIKEKLINALVSWQDSITLKLGMTTKKIIFDDFSSQEITLVTIRVMPQDSETLYFIFNLPSGITREQIKSKENLEFYDLSDALGTNLSGSQVINLAIQSKQDISQIVFYVSPDLSTLPIENNQNITGTGTKPNITLPIILAVIVLIVLVVVLIFIWKGKRKESSSSSSSSEEMFANPGDLMSLISYIQTSQQEGKDKKTIEKELIDSGWTKAQINYTYKNMGSA